MERYDDQAAAGSEGGKAWGGLGDGAKLFVGGDAQAWKMRAASREARQAGTAVTVRCSEQLAGPAQRRAAPARHDGARDLDAKRSSP